MLLQEQSVNPAMFKYPIYFMFYVYLWDGIEKLLPGNANANFFI